MCGICGIATTGEQPSELLIRKMCNTIAHRGPDGEGIFTAPGIGLGMRRLAVIDLVTGDQPMANETGSIQVVFNGEIYNYRELRHDLIERDHIFRSNCDTEVIPHLYEEYGVDFIEKLNGMFAIALWDIENGRLLLTRDRIGIKPLFYSVKDGSLFFGSEVKCLLAVNGSHRHLDIHALDQLLTFEYTASPRTLLKDVNKLEPGNFLTWQRGELRKCCYWKLSDEKPENPHFSGDEWAERLKIVLDDAVKRQLVSDVPLGCFLSGGIDSSIITSAMNRGSRSAPKTFSIGFSDQTYNELKFARVMAKHCQTEHHEAVLDPDYLSLVEKVIYHMDQPIGDFSVFPTYLVSKIAREKVTVVLSGDGGDELFDLLPSGFHLRLNYLAEHIPLTPAKKGILNRLRYFLECAGLPKSWQHMRWMVFLTPARKRELYDKEVYEAVADQTEEIILQYLDGYAEDRLQRQLFCDAGFYLAENILPKVDLMSMATSLETRVPYLDNEVVALVSSMPSKLKWKGLERKNILKKAYRNELPPAILARKKEGFSIPLKNWLQMEWNPLMHDLLSENTLKQDGLFNPATVSRWIHEHEDNQANHSHLLWSLMVFQLWKNRWMHSN
jgi:asparagine synthase (glutamine-hydrolysing)